MKTKNYMLVIASVFALVLALGLVSATLTFTNIVVPASANDVDGTFQITFDLTNDDILTTLDWTATAIASVAMPTGGDGNPSITFNVASIADGTITPVIVPVTATVTYTTDYGGLTSTIDVTADVAYTDSVGLTSAQQIFSQVNILDTTVPVIDITGSNPAYVDLSGTYTDAGATATDNYDSTLTVTSVSTVNTASAGTYTVTYSAQDSSVNLASQKTRTVIVLDRAKGLCPAGSSSSSLELSQFDITNNGRGDDDKWYPLDTIEIEVEFENNKNSGGLDTYDLEDITFELGIFDSTGKDVSGDMIWLSKDEEKFEFGDVDEGDDAEHIFKFRINPSEFDVNGDYDVTVKAYPAGKESTDCVDFSSDMTSFGSSKYSADVSIKMAKDENAVIVDEENFATPSTAQCEQKVTFTADVWNTGDQDWDDQILVNLLNTELGIDENQTIIGDLDQGDMVQVTFSFNVPEAMEEKTYNLDMRTFYDWDADDSEYDEFSAETFTFPLKLEGNCAVSQVTMTASLESGGQAGQPLVVKATVTNTGTETTTYTFAVTGSSGWASSAKVNSTLTLTAGQSGDIWASFEVDRKAEGDQTFSIETSSEGDLLLTQPVQVAIEGRNGLGFSGDNSAIAILIALISAIAIAIIIVLIVRASKRKA